jgi:hypothetical protein
MCPKLELLKFEAHDSTSTEIIKSIFENSNFKSIIRFNEFFGDDESSGNNKSYSNRKKLGGRLKDNYELQLGVNIDNTYFKYGLFTNENNKDIFLGPSTILIDIKKEESTYKKIKLKDEDINSVIEAQNSDVIIVYGNSSSGKTYLVDNYINKENIESIQLWDFKKKTWDTEEKYDKKTINNKIIRTTFENDHSSRRHKCIKTTDKYIYDLCGAEEELTPKKYLMGLVDENDKVKIVENRNEHKPNYRR